MDAPRFDGLTRTVATADPTRRGALRLLGAGALATVLASFGRGATAAQCVAPGQKCKLKRGKKKKCCGGAKCQDKRCQCPRQRIACGKKCCANGQICAAGQCIAAGSCPTNGADFCQRGFTGNCGGNANCRCFTTMTNATRCGDLASAGASTCGDCDVDADCVALLGPGAFCFPGVGALCACATPGQGICARPCPNE